MRRETDSEVLSGNTNFKGVASLQFVGAAQMQPTIRCGADEVVVGVVCGGVVKLSIRGTEYKATRNMIFAQRGDDITDVRCSKAFKGYLLTVKTQFVTAMNIDTADFIVTDIIARTSSVFQMDDVNADVLYSLAERIVSLEQVEGIWLRDKVVESLIEAYLYMVLSVVGNTSVEQKATRRNSSVVVLNRFYDLLKDNYLRERSVDFYASQLGVTSKYLSIVCTKYRGVTASRIIDGAVIRHAKMLLKQQGVSIQDVATTLNFTSQSFFGKYFKQRVGVSPSRYKGHD